MNVGFIQFEPFWGNKARNRKAVQALIDGKSADLWVLPELFNTGYLFSAVEEVEALSEAIPDGETTQFLIRLSQTYNTAFVAGLAERDDDRLYNTAILVDKTGLVLKYRKVHLFNQEKYWFSPGDNPFAVARLGAVTVGVMICFDWIFPEAARSLALLGAQLIAHPANLVLPFCQDAMITRCLENHVFAVTANRIGTEHRNGQTLSFTGRSQIISPGGKILHRTSEKAIEAYHCNIQIDFADDKQITTNNHLFDDRRPELYMLN